MALLCWLVKHMMIFYFNLIRYVSGHLGWGGWFGSHFVRNPEDRFCRVAAQITLLILSYVQVKTLISRGMRFPPNGILTSADSDEPVQPPFRLRYLKWCSVSSLTLIGYSSDKQRLWSDCAYAQAGLRLCWSHIPHCWKSHALAHFIGLKPKFEVFVVLLLNSSLVTIL